MEYKQSKDNKLADALPEKFEERGTTIVRLTMGVCSNPKAIGGTQAIVRLRLRATNLAIEMEGRKVWA